MSRKWHGTNNNGAFALDAKAIEDQLRSPMPRPGNVSKRHLIERLQRNHRQRMSSQGDNKEKARDEV